MTEQHPDQEGSQEIYNVLTDALFDYEDRTGEQVENKHLYNATSTLLCQILVYMYNDPVEMRKLLEETFKTILETARKHNMSLVKEVIEELDPNNTLPNNIGLHNDTD